MVGEGDRNRMLIGRGWQQGDGGKKGEGGRREAMESGRGEEVACPGMAQLHGNS